MQKEDILSEIAATQSPPVPQKLMLDEIDEATNEIKWKVDPRRTLEAIKHLRLDITRIKEVDLGESKVGGQGTVVPSILLPKASANDKKGDQSAPHFVAVKKITFGEEENYDHHLARYAYELQLLANFSHENIVKPLGFVENVREGVLWMVFNWEANGNMREFVASAKLELPERISLVKDVARGLAYLHGTNPPICHGDLKSLNILVTQDCRAVITDFGSARAIRIDNQGLKEARNSVLSDEESSVSDSEQTLKNIIIDPSKGFLTLTGQNGTISWSAPEVLEDDHFDLTTDVWSFGWICWEAVTGNYPFHERGQPLDDNINRVMMRIVQGELPVLRNDAELMQMEYLCNVMQDCWNLNPAKRPSAQECERSVMWMTQSRPELRTSNGAEKAYSSGLLRALGKVRRENGEMGSAMEYFKRALTVAEAVGDRNSIADAHLEIGRQHVRQSNFIQAEVCLVLARDTHSQIDNQLGTANAVESLGDVYRMRDDYTKATECYILARDSYSRIGHELGMASAVRSLGDVYRMRDDYTKATECYILARDSYSRIGHELGMANAVRSLGDVYRLRCDYTKAEECYILARDIHSRVGDQVGTANAVESLGDVFRLRGDYTKAEECYALARDIYSRVGDQLGSANAIQDLGDVYTGLRDDDTKAEECYILARNSYSRIGYQLGLANAVKGLGDVYWSRGDHTKAEDCCVLARDTYSRIGDHLGTANAVRSLGDMYRMRGDNTKAEECYILPRDDYSRIGNDLGRAGAVKSLGDMYRIRGDDAKAEECYILARDTYTRIGSQLGLANAVRGLGDMYRMRRDYTKATECCLLARDTYFQIGDQLGTAHANESLGHVYRMRGDYNEAEECYTLARDTYSRIGSQPGVANAAISLGAVHLVRKEYAEAEASYTLAHAIGSRIDYSYALEASAEGLDQVKRERNGPT